MAQSNSSRETPRIQRMIVTLGGASIFFASLLSILTGALQIQVPDWVVAITSFVLGAATAAWTSAPSRQR
jgi:hypothetical protein